MVARTSSISTGTKTVIGMILLTAGFLATLGTVFGFFGGVWWAFDFAANFRLQFGVVLVVVSVFYWIIVGKGAALLFLTAGLVNLLLVIPIFAGTQAAAAGDARLDVVTFNVNSEVTARGEIIEWIRTLDADLVILQESTEAWVEALEQAPLDMAVIAVPDFTMVYGTTVLAAIDASARTLPIGTGDKTIVEISTSLGGEDITVFAVHPPAPTSEASAIVHDEMLEAVGTITAARSEPVIVVGDLGATRWSSAFGTLMSEGSLINSEDGNGYQGTWPARDLTVIGPYVSIPVDHALMTRALTTTSRETGPMMGSDHLPLLVQIAPAGA